MNGENLINRIKKAGKTTETEAILRYLANRLSVNFSVQTRTVKGHLAKKCLEEFPSLFSETTEGNAFLAASNSEIKEFGIIPLKSKEWKR
jgi:hypothetical protein